MISEKIPTETTPPIYYPTEKDTTLRFLKYTLK